VSGRGARPRRAPRFHRESAAERRAALVGATLQCLKRHGHEGTSLRRISAVAGISPGLVNHHFPGKAALIAAAYQQLARTLLDSIAGSATASDVTPRERLRRFFSASFEPELLDPGLFRIWLVFWGMVAHSARMRAVHDRTYRACRRALERLLRALASEPAAPAFRPRAAAIGLAALLDGLWVELSLDPRAFRPAQAIALCEDWVEALARGAFPRLRARVIRRGR
jgi:TetR/AcrR family transcriptional regulator, transcriptional repressor of bet genes